MTRGLVTSPLVARTQGLVVPSWRLVAPCIRVAHGHRLRARLVLESLRVVARLELAPSRRQRRAAAAIFGAGAWTTGPAVVAAAVPVVTLAAVWPPVPGIRSYAIFVIVMAAVILAPSTARLETAVAVAAPAATRLSATTDHMKPGARSALRRGRFPKERKARHGSSSINLSLCFSCCAPLGC